MSPDSLAQVYDHPAVIIGKVAETGLDESRPNEQRLMAASLAGAVHVLRSYEDKHQVTFAALHNDALTALREAYTRHVEKPAHYHCFEVVSAVRDLLGLDSE